MLGIVEANAREFFAAIFLGDDVVQGLVGIGGPGESDGDRANSDVFGDGLKPAMNALQEPLPPARLGRMGFDCGTGHVI